MIRILTASLIVLASLATPISAQAADKLSVLLEWFVNPDHAPMVIAKERGLFGDANLDVELIPPSDASAVPRLVSAGEADIGIHYQPNLYLDHEAGLPLVRFGTLVETPLNTVTVLADGPIKSLKDLKGKKVGFSVTGFEDAMLKRMLASEGLSNDDVELINVNFSLSPSLIGGKVDATLGGFRNFELTQMKLEGHAGRAFFPEEHGVPAYDELIFVTRRDSTGDNRLPRFLHAVEQASIYITNHPQEAWQLFIKAYPSLDDELNRTAFFDTLPRFAKRPAALDQGRYQRFATFMKETGLIKAVPPVSDVAVEIK
ncbi:Hydroxymethylpyrimidine ABC transporter substrate-binding component [Neorhizobium galegae bv. officinalis bv. officinalis str. HAMBI 1141]|uniref:Hydroxymethylpyrimidine ABC transporter substrate-binding component n=1 Tax=Neorhizobium galegae bv. officinalis bv. officinalis str. HAMBI 1141 TaxID=1028801 RepID=A0A068T890_NEOGA|nr:ABC transporter substrate-binding protein [Neorhizobium galegae]CDN54668.1 Hydroxymethylpyrimidine ABC transporter substrate-binding component [Neorhizobium galegae bv. officinalis bv. officinalis str. HAMBI 1141]